jgi:hypothetical protein
MDESLKLPEVPEPWTPSMGYPGGAGGTAISGTYVTDVDRFRKRYTKSEIRSFGAACARAALEEAARVAESVEAGCLDPAEEAALRIRSIKVGE